MLTQDMSSYLTSLEIVQRHPAGPMTICFLRSRGGDAARGPAYNPLDQALSQGGVSLVEQPSTERVGKLRLSNHSSTRVFLLGGEIVQGGKQDRIVNTDILVEAGAEVDVPVSCVEKGRWMYSSREFHAGSTASPRIRAALNCSVTASLASTGAPTSDQETIWHEVDTVGKSIGSRSPTSRLTDHYRSAREETLRRLQGIHSPAGACGVIVEFRNGRMVLDSFDRPDALTAYLPKLLEGYAVEALACSFAWPSDTTTRQGLFEGLQTTEHAGVGIGTELRIGSPRILGSALVVEETPLHVSLITV